MDYHIVELPNGEVHTLMNYQDFKHLVEIKLGYDCSKIVDELIIKSEESRFNSFHLRMYKGSHRCAIEELNKLLISPNENLKEDIKEIVEGLKIIAEIYN